MQNQILMSRLGGTALVAVLALTATPTLAQEVTPQGVPQITIPQDSAEPVTTTATPDPLAAEPAVESAPAAEVPAAPTTTTKLKAVTAKPAAKASTSTRSSGPSAAPAASLPAAAEPALVDSMPPEALTPPIAPLAAVPEPTPAPAAETEVAAPEEDVVPIALGAGLGLLALGGAAVAMRRRRRNHADEPVVLSEPTITRRPATRVQQESAMAERSAFAWGDAPAAVGKNWVDRAHRGPTPENPFLSLKKRLQRAAFYDRREREVAAGRAKPLSPMAGLPQRFADAVRKRTPQPSYGLSYAPA